MSKDKTAVYTRRGALGLMIVGGGAVALNSMGFANLDADRGVSLSAAGDEEALVGVFVGESSLAVRNNFNREIEVTIDIDPDGQGGISLVDGDTEATLAPPTTENGEDVLGETTTVAVELDSGTESAPRNVEVTAETTVGSTSVNLIREVEVLPPDEIDPGEDTAEVLVEPDTPDVLATHTWILEDFEHGAHEEPVRSITLDYSPNAVFESTVTDDGSATAIEAETQQGLRVIRGQSGPRENDTQFRFVLQGGSRFDASQIDSLIVLVRNVTNPSESGEAELTLEDEAGNTETFAGDFTIQSQ